MIGYWRLGLVAVIVILSVGCGAPPAVPVGTIATPFQPTAVATATIGVKLSPRITVISPFATPATPEPSPSNNKSANGTRIPTPPDPALQRIIEEAKRDLSNRLALGADEIQLVQAQSITWPNGSLGCPRPGLVYPQVEMDGWLVRLRANSRLYEYHSAANGVPFLCET